MTLVSLLMLGFTTPADGIPPFPIVLDGTWCGYPWCGGGYDNPYRWIVYADGTYDEGAHNMAPNPYNSGTSGTWTFGNGRLTMIGPWGYRGTHTGGGCLTGRWVGLPHDGIVEGEWQACASP